MFGFVRRSIRLKVTMVVLATTIAALLFTGLALSLYDARTYRDSVLRDLIAQADIVGRASTAALAFQDTAVAHQNLALLRVRPQITAAAIYGQDGRRFASYSRADGDVPPIPERPGPYGYRVERGRMVLHRAIDDADGRLGSVYVEARYEGPERLGRFLLMMVGAMLGSVLVALWLTSRLQSTVTRPILEIAEVAHQVANHQDYALRVRHVTDDETGYLVGAFNDMLAEVDLRTRELEATNRKLHEEMGERQEAERALREADRRKDEFLATLAHELRNPLAPIRNAVYLLKHRAEASPDVRRAHELIDRQVQHMVRLIEDLLDISRITRDALELRPATFPLRDLVQEVQDATQHAMDEAGHQFAVSVEPSDVTVRADRARLAQAVLNVVHNAVKYTPKGGRIELRARARGGDLDITVADNGIGLPPDKLTDIFQPFSQIDRSLEKTRGGLGIGLALAQRLVALHGGSVTAHSDGIGKGSTFRMSLPIVVERPVEAPAAPGERVGPPTERLRILVADDNHDAAESMAALVRAIGHEAETAHDGSEALDLARTGGFHAAILDIGMPRLNGYDLARCLRKEPWGRGMLLIALTGWGQPEDKQRAFDAGFDEHMTKPVHPEQLTELLSRAHRDGGARRAL